MTEGRYRRGPLPTLNRSIGQAVVPLLGWLRLTPTQVTLLALATGLLAAWAFAKGPDHAVEGALWLQLSFVLDTCDGALARRLDRTSGFGSWLDTISDMLINALLFLALGAGLSREPEGRLWLHTGVVAAIGVVFSYVASFALQVHRRGPDAWRHPDPPREEVPDSALVSLRKRAREDFSWIVLASALAGHMGWLVLCGLAGGFAVGAAAVRSIVRGQVPYPHPPGRSAPRRV